MTQASRRTAAATPPPVRIATRGSDLALAQARGIAARIESELGRMTRLVVLRTTGDREQAVSLAKIGGKGLFVKELEEALLDGRADVAVHSAKDLPAALPPDLGLVAFPERADPRDALVTRAPGGSLDALPSGARVGTGSVRRAAQLLRHRRDLRIVPLRGNVPTRLRKLESDDLDAVVLACAGLERLGLAERIDERLAPHVLLPAVGQGCLALEARRADPLAHELARLDDPASARRAGAERAFQARLGGDCTVPLAALAELREGGLLHVRGLLLSIDGARAARGERLAGADAADVGRACADAVLADGGDRILAALRADPA